MVGAGVLGFPKKFGDAGWFVSPLILLCCGAASAEMGNAMVQALVLSEDRIRAGASFSFGRPEKYEDIVEAAFGRIGKLVASVCLNGFMLCMCGAFMILIGMSMEYITNVWLPYRAWVVVCTLVFLPLCLLKDMELISRLSAVGLIASAIYVLSIVEAGLAARFTGGTEAYEFRPWPKQGEEDSVILLLKKFSSTTSVFLLGFGFHVVVPTVRAEMEAPSEMPRAINWAVLLVGFVYFSVGFVGYYGWGDNVQGNVLDSMVNPDGTKMLAGRALALAVIANLIVTYPICMSCVSLAAESYCGGIYNVPLRIILLATTAAVALFCPTFLAILELLASTVGSMSLTLIPLCVFWKLALSSGKKPSMATTVKHFLIVITAIMAMVVGTWQSVEELAKAFQDQCMNPFSHFMQPMSGCSEGSKGIGWCTC